MDMGKALRGLSMNDAIDQVRALRVRLRKRPRDVFVHGHPVLRERSHNTLSKDIGKRDLDARRVEPQSALA